MSQSLFYIPRDRAIMPAPFYWNHVSQTHPLVAEMHGIRPAVAYHYSYPNETRMVAVHLKNEWDTLASHITKHLYTDPSYIARILSLEATACGEIECFYADMRAFSFVSVTTDNLLALATLIEKHWVHYDRIVTPVWLWGSDGLAAKLKNDFSVSGNDWEILTAPQELTYASRFEQSLTNALLAIKKDGADLDTQANALSATFGWLPYGYNGPEFWSKDVMKKRLAEDERTMDNLEQEISERQTDEQIKRERRERLLDNASFTKTDIDRIETLRTCALLTDRRKRYTSELNYWYGCVVDELSLRIGVSRIHLFYHLTEELPIVVSDPSAATARGKKRMHEAMITEGRDGTVTVLEGEERERIKASIDAQLKGEQDRRELRGTVASKGQARIYQGIAKIILHPSDGTKLLQGEFLVSTMTTPDFAPFMKLAAGFITDEGGVTSHAAIIGREMNKPVIIATGNATNVLKDGDQIEVDTENGIVRKL